LAEALHSQFLALAKRECDYLILALPTGYDLRSPDYAGSSTILKYENLEPEGLSCVDELNLYVTEEGFMDFLTSAKINEIILSDTFKSNHFVGREYCEEQGIELCFISENGHDGSFKTLIKPEKSRLDLTGLNQDEFESWLHFGSRKRSTS
jgi:glycerol-3-phosphate cytidylyltransferase